MERNVSMKVYNRFVFPGPVLHTVNGTSLTSILLSNLHYPLHHKRRPCCEQATPNWVEPLTDIPLHLFKLGYRRNYAIHTLSIKRVVEAANWSRTRC